MLFEQQYQNQEDKEATAIQPARENEHTRGKRQKLENKNKTWVRKEQVGISFKIIFAN